MTTYRSAHAPDSVRGWGFDPNQVAIGRDRTLEDEVFGDDTDRTPNHTVAAQPMISLKDDYESFSEPDMWAQYSGAYEFCGSDMEDPEVTVR